MSSQNNELYITSCYQLDTLKDKKMVIGLRVCYCNDNIIDFENYPNLKYLTLDKCKLPLNLKLKNLEFLFIGNVNEFENIYTYSLPNLKELSVFFGCSEKIDSLKYLEKISNFKLNKEIKKNKSVERIKIDSEINCEYSYTFDLSNFPNVKHIQIRGPNIPLSLSSLKKLKSCDINVSGYEQIILRTPVNLSSLLKNSKKLEYLRSDHPISFTNDEFTNLIRYLSNSKIKSIQLETQLYNEYFINIFDMLCNKNLKYLDYNTGFYEIIIQWLLSSSRNRNEIINYEYQGKLLCFSCNGNFIKDSLIIKDVENDFVNEFRQYDKGKPVGLWKIDERFIFDYQKSMDSDLREGSLILFKEGRMNKWVMYRTDLNWTADKSNYEYLHRYTILSDFDESGPRIQQNVIIKNSNPKAETSMKIFELNEGENELGFVIKEPVTPVMGYITR
jgi:hypothetical protein